MWYAYCMVQSMKTVLISVRILDSWSGFERGTVRSFIATVRWITWLAFVRVLELQGDRVMPSLYCGWRVKCEGVTEWLADWLPNGTCFWGSPESLADWLPSGAVFLEKPRVPGWLNDWLLSWGNVSGEAQSPWLTDYPVGQCFWRSPESLADWLPSGAVFLEKPRVPGWLNDWLLSWGDVSGEAESPWLTDCPVGQCFWRSRESQADWLTDYSVGAMFLEKPRVPGWLTTQWVSVSGEAESPWLTDWLPSGTVFLKKPRFPDLSREIPCLVENQEFQYRFHKNSWVNSILNLTKPLCAAHTHTQTHTHTHTHTHTLS